MKYARRKIRDKAFCILVVEAGPRARPETNGQPRRVAPTFTSSASPATRRLVFLFRPAEFDRHIDPVTVGILDAVVGILVGFGIDLGVESRFFEPASDFVEIIDLETEMIDALLLVFALDLDQRDVDVAVGHVDRAAESALGLQAENLLIKLHHLLPVFRHHRDVSYFGSVHPCLLCIDANGSERIEPRRVLPLDLPPLYFRHAGESAVAALARRRPGRALDGKMARPENVAAADVTAHAQAFAIVPAGEIALALEQLGGLE